MLSTGLATAAGPAGVATFVCRDGAALHLLAFDPVPEPATLVGPSVASGFSTFMIQVRFIAATVIAQDRGCARVERAHRVWVVHDKLIGALRSPDASPVVEVMEGPVGTVHLWPVSAKALRKAVDDRVMPTRDPCAK